MDCRYVRELTDILTDNNPVCDCCGLPIVRKIDRIGTGYALTDDNKKICYSCCGKQDKLRLQHAEIGDKFVFYLCKSKDSPTGYVLTNWPGTFRHYVRVQEGRHRSAGIRRDFWFQIYDLDSCRVKYFYGVQYGDNTELAHIKCIKGKRV